MAALGSAPPITCASLQQHSGVLIDHLCVCRVVSFLCDLTFWALQAQHERLCPADVQTYSDTEVRTAAHKAAVLCCRHHATKPPPLSDNLAVSLMQCESHALLLVVFTTCLA